MPGIRDEIRSQPDVIRKTAESVSTGLGTLTRYATELKNGRPVIITGMGGSHSAGMLLQYGLIESGIAAFVIESSELLYHQRPLLANQPLIVMISQSGESREVVRLLDELDAAHLSATVIGLTNTPNSSLATRSTHTLMMQAGDEKTVSTKTYTCTLAALILLNSVLNGSDQQAAMQAVKAAAQAIETSLPDWEAKAKHVAEHIKATTFLECLGRGASKASAFTAALISKETAKLPTEAMVGGGFRHGPIEVVTPEISVTIFMGSGMDRSLNEALASDVEARGASVIRIGGVEHDLGFNLPALDDLIMPIAEIVPAQLVAVELAALRGFTPGEFRYIAKVTTKE